MQNNWNTGRLSLEPLTENDAAFMLRLLNTEGWLRFIGDRNVHSEADALGYVLKILNNPDVQYWVVRLNEGRVPLGIITLIKRAYLPHPDIGFAFLPEYTGKGYAHDAALAVFSYLVKDPAYPVIMATTVPENTSSIQLLKKLGLMFEKEIVVEGEKLFLFTTQ